MYEELVKMLRVCGDSNNSCGNCPVLEDGSCPYGEWEFAAEKYMLQAADAIEELDTLLDGVTADNDALCETIERMKKPHWIPVTERLPDCEALALNALKGSHGYHEYLLGYVGADSESDTGFRCESEGEILMNVTHWMPLPEPPKERKNDDARRT